MYEVEGMLVIVCYRHCAVKRTDSLCGRLVASLWWTHVFKEQKLGNCIQWLTGILIAFCLCYNILNLINVVLMRDCSAVLTEQPCCCWQVASVSNEVWVGESWCWPPDLPEMRTTDLLRFYFSWALGGSMMISTFPLHFCHYFLMEKYTHSA